MADDSDQLDCPLQERSLHGKSELGKDNLAIYTSYISYFIYCAIVEFRASAAPLIKRSKQKGKLNHRLVLTPNLLLSRSTSIICNLQRDLPITSDDVKEKKKFSLKQM